MVTARWKLNPLSAPKLEFFGGKFFFPVPKCINEVLIKQEKTVEY